MNEVSNTMGCYGAIWPGPLEHSWQVGCLKVEGCSAQRVVYGLWALLCNERGIPHPKWIGGVEAYMALFLTCSYSLLRV